MPFLSLKLNMVSQVITLSFVLFAGFFMMTNKNVSFSIKAYSIFVMAMAVYLLVQRTTYLPFLGRTAFPSGVLRDEQIPENANVSYTLTFSPQDEGKKVIFWGAKPSSTTLPNPWEAYDDFSNAGIAVVRNGKAEIQFHCPAKYKIPWGATLDRHVHYRLCCDSGLMGPVETAYVNC